MVVEQEWYNQFSRLVLPVPVGSAVLLVLCPGLQEGSRLIRLYIMTPRTKMTDFQFEGHNNMRSGEEAAYLAYFERRVVIR